jgi:uracil-DNA glycosylase
MPAATASASGPAFVARLREKYPDARYELDWTTPLELLVATILAAQCTDERVNRVTPALFAKYRSARAYADAAPAALEEDVRPTGFYRNKAKAIQGACRALVQRFGGEVPRSMAEMITLPGVARKTANVVLNTAFDAPTGIIVDTHVARVSRRLGLSRQEDPDRIEQDLMRVVGQAEWTFFGPAMVLHGRYTCTARAPRCGDCVLATACEKRLEPGVTAAAISAASAGPEAAVKTSTKATTKGTRAEVNMKTTASAKTRAASKPAEPSAAAGKSKNAGGMPPLPASWQPVLAGEIAKPYFAALEAFVAQERASHDVFPPADEVFSALALTPYDDVRVLLLGQDPYHDDGQAHGLCFSVRPGVKPPPSLVNMYKELQTDVGFRIPNNGFLEPWARQGVLMLNAVLTVRAHTPNSHKDKGWETFTDAVLRKVNEKTSPVVFVLWGGYAQKKAKLIDTARHTVIQSAHPSPLSARNGFFGSRPFSKINEALGRTGTPPIDWQLPNV